MGAKHWHEYAELAGGPPGRKRSGPQPVGRGAVKTVKVMHSNTRALASCWVMLCAGALLIHCSATPAPSPTPDASVAAEAGLDAREPPRTDGSVAACGIPPGLTLDEEPRCTTRSPGLFTEYAMSTQAKTYHVDLCNVEESEVPRDQGAFDQEVVGSAPFLKSNGDFVRTSDCASGSVTVDSGSVSRIVWIRQK